MKDSETCRQVRLELAAEPSSWDEATAGHLGECEDCAAFARDAARLGALAGALPSPPLPARARARAPAPPTRARWLLVPAALAALAALWVLSRPAPSPSPVALAARDAAPAPTAPGPVDLLGQMDEAHAVWAGTRPPWGAGASAVQGLDPVSDIFSSGLLTEAIGTVGEPQTSND